MQHEEEKTTKRRIAAEQKSIEDYNKQQKGEEDITETSITRNGNGKHEVDKR